MPDCFSSSFTEKIISLNKCLADFDRWHFLDGMSFKESNKWWADCGKRPVPHEGVDLLSFVDKSAKIKRLAGDIILPPVQKGVVAKTFPDFLGQTIILKHDLINSEGCYLHSAFGHVEPLRRYLPGDLVEEGQPLAVLATDNDHNNIPPHLHISIFWLNATFPLTNLDWSTIGSSDKIILVDPLEIL